jgi:hypothetical protein
MPLYVPIWPLYVPGRVVHVPTRGVDVPSGTTLCKDGGKGAAGHLSTRTNIYFAQVISGIMGTTFVRGGGTAPAPS